MKAAPSSADTVLLAPVLLRQLTDEAGELRLTTRGLAHLPGGVLQRSAGRVVGDSPISGVAALIRVVLLLPVFALAARTRRTAFAVSYADVAWSRWELRDHQRGLVTAKLSVGMCDSDSTVTHVIHLRAQRRRIQQIAETLSAAIAR